MNQDLGRYLNQWQLSDPEPLVETFTSDLFKVQASGQTAVLKILSEAGAVDERAAIDVLHWYDGHGAVRLLRHDSGAMLLEYIDGEDLTELVKNGRDDEATKIIADVLNRLHFASRSKIPGGLTPLLRRFQSLFDKVSQDQQQDSIFRRGAAVASDLLSDQGTVHVLHGDIHHGNIRLHGARGWLAIDPKGLIGDRTYDAANALCNPHSLPEIVQNPERLSRQAEIMATALDLDRKRLLSYTFAHACLSACWSLEDGHDPRHSLAVAKITESCLSRLEHSPGSVHRNGLNWS